jgi:cell division septum initiation protein DivIVA
VTTEVAALRDEADRYAKSTRHQAEADANHMRDEADAAAKALTSEADAAAKALTREAHEQAQRTVRDANDEESALSAEALEPPWVSRTLLTLETRMESWDQQSSPRRSAGTRLS